MGAEVNGLAAQVQGLAKRLEVLLQHPPEFADRGRARKRRASCVVITCSHYTGLVSFLQRPQLVAAGVR